MAGVFGGLIVFGIAIMGAAMLVEPGLSVPNIFMTLEKVSPWFMAWLLIGAIAGVQLVSALALLVAGESLVRNVYKPYFHATLSRRDTVNLTRVVVGILALASVLMQSLTPIALSALGSVVLPMSFQLWAPLLGVTWLRWITRPAAATGVAFGLAGVILTEPLGYEILSFFGLELPWGRWPWTIHSAAWGMAANLVVVLIISAITNREAFGEEAQEVRRFLQSALRVSGRAQALRSVAWAAILIWLFLAVGPGVEFGNFAFGVPGAGRGWILGMPSLWAWSALFWVLGVGLLWFLAYKLEMASPVTAVIDAYEPRPRLHLNQGQRERERLRALVITGAVGFGLAVLIAFSFGR
jgi:SSS family solute:Na+ symporter